MRNSLYHLGRVCRGPSSMALPRKIWCGWLWGETYQGQRAETTEKERHWVIRLLIWHSLALPLSPLQQTFSGKDRPDQPSPHTSKPQWYEEVSVVFACEGRYDDCSNCLGPCLLFYDTCVSSRRKKVEPGNEICRTDIPNTSCVAGKKLSQGTRFVELIYQTQIVSQEKSWARERDLSNWYTKHKLCRRKKVEPGNEICRTDIPNTNCIAGKKLSQGTRFVELIYQTQIVERKQVWQNNYINQETKHLRRLVTQ